MRQNATAIRLFLESADFSPDGLNYTDCPECGHKGKLMVGLHQDGCAWYKCLRVRCGMTGMVGRGFTVPQPKPKVRLHEEPLFSLANERRARAHLADDMWKYKAVSMEQDWAARVCSGRQDGRFVFPVRSAVGERVGSVLKSFTMSPKVLTLRHVPDVPLLAWYGAQKLMDHVSPIVLVEDQLSAARLGDPRWAIGVALLGTHLSQEAADYIKAVNLTKHQILICLDNDATNKAAAMRRLFPSARVVPLQQDIKDMTEGEFEVWAMGNLYDR